jgi:hypothetical protein
MTKFFVDNSGNYLGGFEGADPPQGAIEVPTPPAHGLDTWNGNAWVPNAAVAAEAARVATDAAEQETVKADNQVMTFLNMTPTQLDNWVATNIEAGGLTLAQVKANTGTALRVLGRIALAAGRGRFLR